MSLIILVCASRARCLRENEVVRTENENMKSLSDSATSRFKKPTRVLTRAETKFYKKYFIELYEKPIICNH